MFSGFAKRSQMPARRRLLVGVSLLALVVAALAFVNVGTKQGYSQVSSQSRKVRLAPDYRKSAEAIQNLRIGVAGPNGSITQIPLNEIASINLVSGAAYIYREQQERYLPIKFSVRERDLGSAVREAQDKVAA